MTHESNPKEAIPVGIGLAVSNQVHARYLQSYNLQWPWELIYADLGNGAQLQFDLQTYHDTPRGLIKTNPKAPTYRVLATLRLPNGESVVLNDKLHAEHLEHRTVDSIASKAGTMISSAWVQGWKFRVAYRGGRPEVREREARPRAGLRPRPDAAVRQERSAPDDQRNNRLTQRVPFDVTRLLRRLPGRGFAWSELLANWYGWEDRDPWMNRGGKLPKTPEALRREGQAAAVGQDGRAQPADGAGQAAGDP